MPPDRLAPYRVEWRANLVTGWCAHKTADTHDEARLLAQTMRQDWDGQTRIISQHVIELEGLGA